MIKTAQTPIFSRFSGITEICNINVRILMWVVRSRVLSPIKLQKHKQAITELNCYLLTQNQPWYHYTNRLKRCAQDSNLQALSSQRFSRPLPPHPDTQHIHTKGAGTSTILIEYSPLPCGLVRLMYIKTLLFYQIFTVFSCIPNTTRMLNSNLRTTLWNSSDHKCFHNFFLSRY